MTYVVILVGCSSLHEPSRAWLIGTLCYSLLFLLCFMQYINVFFFFFSHCVQGWGIKPWSLWLPGRRFLYLCGLPVLWREGYPGLTEVQSIASSHFLVRNNSVDTFCFLTWRIVTFWLLCGRGVYDQVQVVTAPCEAVSPWHSTLGFHVWQSNYYILSSISVLKHI